MPACPKPIREPKPKKTYSSLQQKVPLRPKVNKKKKETNMKKKTLFPHNRTPSRKDRAEFPTKVVKELTEEAEGRCQCGCGRPDTSNQ